MHFVDKVSTFASFCWSRPSFKRSRSRPSAKSKNWHFQPRGVAKSGKSKDVSSETLTFLTLLAQRRNASFKKMPAKLD